MKKVYVILKKNYYSKSKIQEWYFRRNAYPKFQNEKRFLNYNINLNDNSLTLTSIDEMSKLMNRDFHELDNLNYDDLEINLNFENNDKEDNKFENNKKNKIKTGLLWLYNGNNKLEFLNDLFEFNNILPKSHKNNNVKYLYDFKLQEAPFNPIKYEEHIMDYNYFDLYTNQSNSNFEDYINLDHLDLFSKMIKQSAEDFIEKNELDNLFVGGFSQGGCMSIYSYFKELKNIEKVKGIISINGLFLNNNFTYDEKNKCSFLLINGYNNDIITLGKARVSFKKMNSIVCKNAIETIEEHGLFHSFSQTSLKNVGEFILKRTINDKNEKI